MEYQLWILRSGEGWKVYDFFPTAEATRRGLADLRRIAGEIDDYRIVVLNVVDG